MRRFAETFIILFLSAVSCQIFAQTEPRTKPEIKDFGASLKRPPEENSTRKNIKSKTIADEDTILVETNLVVANYLVIDKKGNPIYGLTKDDFVITENGEPQEIQTFTLGDDIQIPRSIVLIIDYSGSQLPYLETSIEAAKLLVNKLRPNDLMAIATDDVELIAQFTSDKKLLKEKLDSLKKVLESRPPFRNNRPGASKQFSTLYAVLNEMFDDEDVRPIILFQTDGDELFRLKGSIEQVLQQQNLGVFWNGAFASFGFNDLSDKLERSNATVYTVVPGFRRIGLSEKEKEVKLKAQQEFFEKDFEKRYGKPFPKPSAIPPQMSEFFKKRDEIIKKYYPNGLPDFQDALFALSKLSGGWIDFLEKPEDADGIYSRILSEINKRYIIGYSPTNEAKDGKRRVVKIEIKNHPEYIVWGRKTYYAPLPD